MTMQVLTDHCKWMGRDDTSIKIRDEEFEAWVYQYGDGGKIDVNVTGPNANLELESFHQLNTLIGVLEEAKIRYLELGT